MSFVGVQMTDRLDAAGCRPLPEEAYPRSLIGVLPAGKRVNLRLDVPNKHDENSAAVAYFQVVWSLQSYCTYMRVLVFFSLLGFGRVSCRLSVTVM